MPRKARIEYPGACYHVINRGNYRSWVFEEDKAKEAFEGALFEACRRSDWILHAFVLMGNHFHLAVETPNGNLVAGMQWLQSTFAVRFNRLRREQGHLFQGRYKALLVEPGESLGRVCHYIHLNPVRAGIVDPGHLHSYRYGSYWYLRHPHERPGFLNLQVALTSAGALVDTTEGWKCYEKYLAYQDETGAAGRSKAYVSLSRGWVLGSEVFRARLLKEHGAAELARAWDYEGARAAREMQWSQVLKDFRNRLGVDVLPTSKSHPSKVALATAMKQSTDAANEWLADQLGMGSGAYVSKLVCDLKRERTGPAWKALETLGIMNSMA